MFIRNSDTEKKMASAISDNRCKYFWEKIRKLIEGIL